MTHIALFRLAFTTGTQVYLVSLANNDNSQAHYAKGTPSHSNKCSDRLKAHGFRNYFTPLIGVLFTFPSRYLFTIGLTGVFSLTGWARPIHAGFLVTRATQDTATDERRFAYGAITLYGQTFQIVPLATYRRHRGPTTPTSLYNDVGLGSSPFARHY